MEHTNEIAIKILSEEFSDYKHSPWGYNREYEMLVKAIEIAKQNISSQIKK